MKIGIYLVLLILCLGNQLSAQAEKICEINVEYEHSSTKDSIVGTEIGVINKGEYSFNWDGVGAVVTLDSTHKKIYCTMMDFVLNPADTIEFREICIAHIYINMQTCEIKKEILSRDYLSNSVQKLIEAYPYYKKKMKNWTIKKKHPYENQVLRYSYDLTYAALLGDSIATELLLSLNKDFKLFRTGLDL